MPAKFANNARSTLFSAITAVQTTGVLASGGGAQFPITSASDYFYATIIDGSNIPEIVKVTTRTGDNLTWVRGQDGTSARAFGAGATVYLSFTKAAAEELLRTDLSNVASAAVARAALGSTAVGDALFTALNSAAARSALGSSAVGDAVFVATDAATARSALGAAASGPLASSGITGALPAASPNYTGGLTGDTSVVNLGSGQFYKDSSGNVGIGTAVPTYRLHVSTSSYPGMGVYRDLDVGSSGNTAQRIDLGARSGSTFTPGAAVVGILESGAATGSLTLATRSGGALSDQMGIASNGQQSSVIPGGASTLYNEYKCRAWVNFNGTGTVAIRASGNVSSITDNGVGDYTINFTTNLPDANYAPTFGVRSITGGSTRTAFIHPTIAPTVSALRIHSYDGSASLTDLDYINVAVFR